MLVWPSSANAEPIRSGLFHQSVSFSSHVLMPDVKWPLLVSLLAEVIHMCSCEPLQKAEGASSPAAQPKAGNWPPAGGHPAIGSFSRIHHANSHFCTAAVSNPAPGILSLKAGNARHAMDVGFVDFSPTVKAF